MILRSAPPSARLLITHSYPLLLRFNSTQSRNLPSLTLRSRKTIQMKCRGSWSNFTCAKKLSSFGKFKRLSMLISLLPWKLRRKLVWIHQCCWNQLRSCRLSCYCCRLLLPCHHVRRHQYFPLSLIALCLLFSTKICLFIAYLFSIYNCFVYILLSLIPTSLMLLYSLLRLFLFSLSCLWNQIQCNWLKNYSILCLIYAK